MHHESLVGQGIAEGKVTRIETKQNEIVKKEAKSGMTVDINQPTSVSRIEKAKASSVNPYEKVTPITPSKPIGSITNSTMVQTWVEKVVILHQKKTNCLNLMNRLMRTRDTNLKMFVNPKRIKVYCLK